MRLLSGEKGRVGRPSDGGPYSDFGSFGGLKLLYNVRETFLNSEHREVMLDILENNFKQPVKHHFYDELTDVGDGPPLTLGYLINKYSIVYEDFKGLDVWKDIKVDEWLSSDKDTCDEIFESIFPFRTKDDKRIRNIRSLDILLFLRHVRVVDNRRYNTVLRNIQGTFYGAIDYIFCCNLILNICLCNDSVLDFWVFSSVSKLGTWGFVDKMKKMSDEIKSSRKGAFCWNNLTELGCLAGYKNPPVPGFDIQKEAISLATGGEEHNYPFDFEEYANKKLNKTPFYNNKNISFKEYVRSGVWATSGSSSLGKIEIKDNKTGEVKTIKCRKNFVLDVITADEIYEECLKSSEQINKTLLKCELGKIRLAVAGDLYNYIQTSYIVYLSGSNYLNWEGVTLEENTTERVKRLMFMKRELRNKISVPFDFKSFDHQVTTKETVDIAMQIVYSADTGGSAHNDYKTIRDNVISSFYNATLITRLNGRSYVDLYGEKQEMKPVDLREKITGGLPSGVRLTSVLGNGYNKMVTSMVIDCMCILGEDRNDFSYYVQGDDTALFCKTKRQGLMIIRCYQMFNIKFDRGKFSVQVGNTEYLRVWFSANRTFSYMARTLPNLTQRKPWSNTPWSPSGVLSGLWDKIGILKRRDCNAVLCDKLWDVLLSRWCALHDLPIASVSVPTSLGGLGIGIWNGEDCVSPKIPFVKRNGYTVESKTSFRKERLVKKAEQLNIHFKVDYDKMAQDELSGVVSGDDVPAAAIYNRREWKDLISKSNFIVSKIKKVDHKLTTDSVQYIKWDSTTSEEWNTQVSWLQFETSRYGKHSFAVGRLKEFKEFRRFALQGEEAESMSEWCRENEPALWADLQTLRRKGHMTDVLDYLGGNINLGENLINKDVSDIYTRYCIIRLSPSLRRNDILSYYSEMRPLLLTGFMGSGVYNYCFSSV